MSIFNQMDAIEKGLLSDAARYAARAWTGKKQPQAGAPRAGVPRGDMISEIQDAAVGARHIKRILDDHVAAGTIAAPSFPVLREGLRRLHRFGTETRATRRNAIGLGAVDAARGQLPEIASVGRAPQIGGAPTTGTSMVPAKGPSWLDQWMRRPFSASGARGAGSRTVSAAQAKTEEDAAAQIGSPGNGETGTALERLADAGSRRFRAALDRMTSTRREFGQGTATAAVMGPKQIATKAVPDILREMVPDELKDLAPLSDEEIDRKIALLGRRPSAGTWIIPHQFRKNGRYSQNVFFGNNYETAGAFDLDNLVVDAKTGLFGILLPGRSRARGSLKGTPVDSAGQITPEGKEYLNNLLTTMRLVEQQISGNKETSIVSTGRTGGYIEDETREKLKEAMGSSAAKMLPREIMGALKDADDPFQIIQGLVKLAPRQLGYGKMFDVIAETLGSVLKNKYDTDPEFVRKLDPTENLDYEWSQEDSNLAHNTDITPSIDGTHRPTKAPEFEKPTDLVSHDRLLHEVLKAHSAVPVFDRFGQPQLFGFPRVAAEKTARELATLRANHWLRLEYGRWFHDLYQFDGKIVPDGHLLFQQNKKALQDYKELMKEQYDEYIKRWEKDNAPKGDDPRLKEDVSREVWPSYIGGNAKGDSFLDSPDGYTIPKGLLNEEQRKNETFIGPRRVSPNEKISGQDVMDGFSIYVLPRQLQPMSAQTGRPLTHVHPGSTVFELSPHAQEASDYELAHKEFLDHIDHPLTSRLILRGDTSYSQKGGYAPEYDQSLFDPYYDTDMHPAARPRNEDEYEGGIPVKDIRGEMNGQGSYHSISRKAFASMSFPSPLGFSVSNPLIAKKHVKLLFGTDDDKDIMKDAGPMFSEFVSGYGAPIQDQEWFEFYSGKKEPMTNHAINKLWVEHALQGKNEKNRRMGSYGGDGYFRDIPYDELSGRQKAYLQTMFKRIMELYEEKAGKRWQQIKSGEVAPFGLESSILSDMVDGVSKYGIPYEKINFNKIKDYAFQDGPQKKQTRKEFFDHEHQNGHEYDTTLRAMSQFMRLYRLFILNKQNSNPIEKMRREYIESIGQAETGFHQIPWKQILNGSLSPMEAISQAAKNGMDLTSVPHIGKFLTPTVQIIASNAAQQLAGRMTEKARETIANKIAQWKRQRAQNKERAERSAQEARNRAEQERRPAPPRSEYETRQVSSGSGGRSNPKRRGWRDLSYAQRADLGGSPETIYVPTEKSLFFTIKDK